MDEAYNINGCYLRLTSGACPEQYDVYYDNKQIGYLRLRHGHFRAHYPDIIGEIVFEAHPRGDGRFFDDERELYLTEAVEMLLKAHDEKKGEPD